MPSAPTVQTSTLPPPAGNETYAIFVPSGDHAGSDSSSTEANSGVCPLPSAFIVYSSWLPSAQQRTNAIREPSGDHDGSASICVFCVSRLRPEPSAFIT